MKYWFAVALVAGLALPTIEVQAQGARSGSGSGIEHRASEKYRGRPQVRGFVQRRGGYSYTPSDSINTYGNSRSNFGSTNSYRDPMADRQTRFGPFDHGFFFDSGIAPRGGNSPYPN